MLRPRGEEPLLFVMSPRMERRAEKRGEEGVSSVQVFVEEGEEEELADNLSRVSLLGEELLSPARTSSPALCLLSFDSCSSITFGSFQLTAGTPSPTFR